MPSISYNEDDYWSESSEILDDDLDDYVTFGSTRQKGEYAWLKTERERSLLREARDGTSDISMSLLPTFQLKGNKRSLYLTQGAGGIYSFPISCQLPVDTTQTTSITVTGCQTCVGVYIPIDDKRCFAAHFDGPLDLPPPERNVVAWQIPKHLSRSFRAAIRSNLQDLFKELQTELKSFQQREDLKARSIVVCPWRSLCGRKGPGFHFIEVLCEFFHLDRARILESPNLSYHGFIVDHFDKSPSGTTMLGWTRPNPSEKDHDLMAEIANQGAKDYWGENMRSVFRATHDYVMPFSLGWTLGVPDEEKENTEWFITCCEDAENDRRLTWCRRRVRNPILPAVQGAR